MNSLSIETELATRIHDVRLVRDIIQRYQLSHHDMDAVFIAAASQGFIATLKYIIGIGYHITQYAKCYIQACEMAAMSGHIAVVKMLHKHGYNIRHNNDAMLQLAAEHGQLAMMRYLHKKGANLRVRYHAVWRLAAMNGHLDIIHYLDSATTPKACVKIRALALAIGQGHVAVVRYLFRADTDP